MRTQPEWRCSGFTLIEMLIVLTIIAMALAVAPAIMAGLDGSRLRAASFELITFLREARGLARRTESVAELTLNLTRKAFTLSSDQRNHPLPTVVDTVDVTPPARVEADQTGADRIARIRFQPDGSATEARVTLRRGGLSAVIVIDAMTGRIRRDG